MPWRGHTILHIRPLNFHGLSFIQFLAGGRIPPKRRWTTCAGILSCHCKVGGVLPAWGVWRSETRLNSPEWLAPHVQEPPCPRCPQCWGSGLPALNRWGSHIIPASPRLQGGKTDGYNSYPKTHRKMERARRLWPHNIDKPLTYRVFYNITTAESDLLVHKRSNPIPVPSASQKLLYR